MVFMIYFCKYTKFLYLCNHLMLLFYETYIFNINNSPFGDGVWVW